MSAVGSRRGLVEAAALATLAVGVMCIAAAGSIQAKAALAQVLIRSAWLREQHGQRATQPWPWADTTPLARLTLGGAADAPALIVLEGASGRNLDFGPVHDPVSVVPGAVGNSVIEGHRDTHFAELEHVGIGDTLQVETVAGRHLRFEVTDVRVVDSRNARIALNADHPRLTLVTCYPFDAVVPGGPLRWVVSADLVEVKRGRPGGCVSFDLCVARAT